MNPAERAMVLAVPTASRPATSQPYMPILSSQDVPNRVGQQAPSDAPASGILGLPWKTVAVIGGVALVGLLAIMAVTGKKKRA